MGYRAMLFMTVVSAVLIQLSMSAGSPATPGGGVSTAPVQQAVLGLETRFIAIGVIVQVQPVIKGVQKVVMKIEEIRSVPGYPAAGSAYRGKEVELFSETALPAFVKANAKVSVTIRVVGDEWRQSLFLVEVVEHETQNR